MFTIGCTASITAKCIINQGQTEVHFRVHVELIGIFICCRDIFSRLRIFLFFFWTIDEYWVLAYCVDYPFLFSFSVFLDVVWACCASTMALRQHFSQRIFQRTVHKWLGSPALCLHCIISPLWTQERCFSTSVKRLRCSLFLFLFAHLFIPFKSVDRTFVGMTRSAAYRETTAPPSPVARSSWIRPTTISLWSPGNFPGCLLCCFSSRWDTSSSERCVPNPGSSPRHTMDTHLLPHRKTRSWRAAQRIQLLPLSCRHMKKRCGMGAEQLESNTGQTTWQEPRFDEMGIQYTSIHIIRVSISEIQTAQDAAFLLQQPCVPLCKSYTVLANNFIAELSICSKVCIRVWLHFLTKHALFNVNKSSRI